MRHHRRRVPLRRLPGHCHVRSLSPSPIYQPPASRVPNSDMPRVPAATTTAPTTTAPPPPAARSPPTAATPRTPPPPPRRPPAAAPLQPLAPAAPRPPTPSPPTSTPRRLATPASTPARPPRRAARRPVPPCRSAPPPWWLVSWLRCCRRQPTGPGSREQSVHGEKEMRRYGRDSLVKRKRRNRYIFQDLHGRLRGRRLGMSFVMPPLRRNELAISLMSIIYTIHGYDAARRVM